MNDFSIYIVDDEETLAKGLELNLQPNYRVKSFFNAQSALSVIEKEPPDLVLLDIGLPDLSGVEALSRIKKSHPEVVVIMITAFEKVETVISAMKLGAYDYIVKPIKMEALDVSIKNAIDSIRLKKEVKSLQEKYLREYMPCFIGESKAISDVMQFVENVAKSPDTPILILGESGTGKELIAGAIHYRSPNFEGPFATVNCASIPKELIESELFGYVGGAFSGANRSGKKGLVEQAANGTLFLDEIGDLSLEAQAKLLRFLESGEFYRVGGLKKSNVKIRLVSATNKDIKSMIKEGLFREDLFFRIGVVCVQVPSLNKRTDDIVPIAKHFLVKYGEKFGKDFSGISPEAVKALEEFSWEGNVRELKNMIELAALTSNGPELTLKDLGLSKNRIDGKPVSESESNIPPDIPEEGVDITAILDAVEKKYISRALKMTNGNETRAARLLHLKSTTLRYRRQRLNIS